MNELIVWLLVLVVWSAVTYLGYRLLRRVAPSFAASHSEETGAMILVFFIALSVALFSL